MEKNIGQVFSLAGIGNPTSMTAVNNGMLDKLSAGAEGLGIAGSIKDTFGAAISLASGHPFKALSSAISAGKEFLGDMSSDNLAEAVSAAKNLLFNGGSLKSVISPISTDVKQKLQIIAAPNPVSMPDSPRPSAPGMS